MEQMNDLETLLRHDIMMLCSVEDQIISALPAMIETASSSALKQALDEHLSVTRIQRERLNRIKEMLGASKEDITKYSGVLASIMGGTTCKGMEGIIDEGQKIMQENLAPEVMDAAIVASSQKVEHFEIASYGTARTYAKQLGLTEVAELLQKTLDEEYMADQELTGLAEQVINVSAAMAAATTTSSTMM